MLDLWYKNTLLYCVDIDTFCDSNGDGVGDFAGLIDHLDHIANLGATSLWLLPFYPTPNRDNGYDVIDHYGVDPRLGSLGDFVELMRRARELGLRIIIDLVVNHTSDQHPWFQQARADPDSPFRDYYVWSETKPPDADKGVVFPGVQESTWTYDAKAGAYYHHRFYEHQPDLNIAHPKVREEIFKIVGFWLELGVSGFRVDAAPFLVEMTGVHQGGEKEDDYRYLKEMRRFLSWRKGDAILLAEANVTPQVILNYFGRGDRMHMVFDFLANQHLFLALAVGRAEPLVRGLKANPPIPTDCQWAQFLRNHDELDLGRLTAEERKAAFAAFAPDRTMRIYDRGIRRRLAPMLENDRRRLELAYSLLMTLPGTPVLYYGEEIGMGEDLSLSERNAVRTPMQWSDQPNAGFSTAPAKQLIRPVISEGPFSFHEVNAEAQSRDGRSLLSWMNRAIEHRRGCPEIGCGDFSLLDPGHPAVLAHRYDWRNRHTVFLHNLSDNPVEIRLPLTGEELERLGTLFAEDDRAERHREGRVSLPAYGYRWLRIAHRNSGKAG